MYQYEAFVYIMYTTHYKCVIFPFNLISMHLITKQGQSLSNLSGAVSQLHSGEIGVTVELHVPTAEAHSDGMSSTPTTIVDSSCFTEKIVNASYTPEELRSASDNSSLTAKTGATACDADTAFPTPSGSHVRNCIYIFLLFRVIQSCYRWNTNHQWTVNCTYMYITSCIQSSL